MISELPPGLNRRNRLSCRTFAGTSYAQ